MKAFEAKNNIIVTEIIFFNFLHIHVSTGFPKDKTHLNSL